MSCDECRGWTLVDPCPCCAPSEPDCPACGDAGCPQCAEAAIDEDWSVEELEAAYLELRETNAALRAELAECRERHAKSVFDAKVARGLTLERIEQLREDLAECVASRAKLLVAVPVAIKDEARTVRRLCRSLGYGRVMQLAEQEWRASLGGMAGGELVVGVCRAMLDRRGFKSSLELLDAYDSTREAQKRRQAAKTRALAAEVRHD